MKVVKLQRVSHSHLCTVGTMSVNGFRCVTLERPWESNEPNVSSIPAGVYEIRLGMYNAGGYPAFEVVDVPNRTLIKIHAANKASQVQGCIALGEYLFVMDGEVAISNSRNTVSDFMAYMQGHPESTLVIEDWQ